MADVTSAGSPSLRGPEDETPRPKAVSKVRSRRGGSAVPLDETDKQLLNLMQGRFPLEPRPFARVAELAELPEAEVLERVQYLLDKRIIREITPIFDTRAFGYASMLVAAKVDPENPHRAAQIINTHPGVTHNYLRDHDFNLWFTIAVEADSALGLDGTLDVLAERTGAESIRQLPTLKLFKIRMDLEMEGGTDALSAPGQAVEPLELDPIELSEEDIATVRATQGPMPVVSEPYAPAAERLGVPVEAVLDRLESLRERGGLRRVAAILYHRRAGFSANGMGVWAVPDGEILDTGKRMAAFRGISHCYQRPTYADWPYSVFTMAHGRSKEECDAILDSIADATGITDRATLYSSTEFKKVRMLYFTDAFARWEEEHGR
jgi:siroheme decarboxylase